MTDGLVPIMPEGDAREKSFGDGIAILTDERGNIIKIIGDDLSIAKQIECGESFTRLIDKESVNKAKYFLLELKSQQAAFNWELNVATDDETLESLHFAGAATEKGFLIVGAKSRASVAKYFEELVKINNEQTNALRSALKDLSLKARTQIDFDNHHYDELSRLNNESATLQRELAKKNSELKKLNEMKNQFLGMAAHDLRNPLEVILTYSQFLLEDASDVLQQEQIEFINRIRSSSSFMLNLVNDFLDISKIEAGKLELELATKDLTRLVEQIVTLNQALADKKKIKIEFKHDETNLFAEIDEYKIIQALNNLIGNAVKFSPQNSVITVRIRTDGNDIVISVKDSGCGIAADEIERLFNPFERGRVRSVGGEKDTGLGLAITKKVIEGHGGKIFVESDVKIGSTFYISFPVNIKDKLS